MRVAGSVSIPRGGNRPGQTVPVTGRVVFIAVRATGGEATEQLRMGRRLPSFGQDRFTHRCSDLG